MVEVPDANVAFAGDILWNHRTPTTLDGTISWLSASLVKLEALACLWRSRHGPALPIAAPQVPDAQRLAASISRDSPSASP